MRQFWEEFEDYGASELLSLSFDAITSNLKISTTNSMRKTYHL